MGYERLPCKEPHDSALLFWLSALVGRFRGNRQGSEAEVSMHSIGQKECFCTR